MQFLLNSLRHHFPEDYNKHQRSREKSMQAAIRRVLNEGFPGLEYLENIKLRVDGRTLTDVDLVVVEKATGTIFLCQLKYQDLYGADLRTKRARIANLKEEVSSWLVSVATWIASVDAPRIRTSLRLKRAFPSPSIYRLVISKHYAYPLKELALGTDGAYSNWVQFFNSIELVKRNVPEHRTLSDLLAMLKKNETPGGAQEHLAEPRSEWMINDLKFTIQQEE
jgi:hypothetical protein